MEKHITEEIGMGCQPAGVHFETLTVNLDGIDVNID